MVLALSYRFYYYYNNIYYLLNHDFILNGSYIILCFLPIVLCLKIRLAKIVCILIISVIVLFSSKRGGTIALGVSLLLYYDYYLNYNKKNKRHKTLSNIVVLTLALFLSLFIFDEMNNLTGNLLSSRFIELQKDTGTDRQNVYKKTYNMIMTSSESDLLLGHGWNAVVKDSSLSLSAHNDLLEVIYDFGVFVFLIYLSFFIAAIGYFIKMRKKQSVYTGQFASALSITFVLSLVSHIIIYPSLLLVVVMTFILLTSLNQNQTDKHENWNTSISVGH